jgi:hypothetical protein
MNDSAAAINKTLQAKFNASIPEGFMFATLTASNSSESADSDGTGSDSDPHGNSVERAKVALAMFVFSCIRLDFSAHTDTGSSSPLPLWASRVSLSSD